MKKKAQQKEDDIIDQEDDNIDDNAIFKRYSKNKGGAMKMETEENNQNLLLKFDSEKESFHFVEHPATKKLQEKKK